MKKVLITGSAGFIGFALSKSLLDDGYYVHGYDGMTDYYDVNLKHERNKILKKYKKFTFTRGKLENKEVLEKIAKKFKPEIILHLAAQAGVRYSIENPRKYIENNINGFFNIIDNCKKFKVKRLFFASSSSVYGENKNFPLNEKEIIYPKNIYALSKKNNEEIAYLYEKYYNLKSTALRFFTVYGEWGRPDMFIMKYLNATYNKSRVFYLNNYGNHFRDFTYINDVCNILKKLIYSKLKYKHLIINICSNKPLKLTKIIKEIDNLTLNKPTIKKRSLQKADILKTHGDNNLVKKITGIKKFTDISIGLKNTVKWFANNKDTIKF